jgi:hypothetical protein
MPAVPDMSVGELTGFDIARLTAFIAVCAVDLVIWGSVWQTLVAVGIGMIAILLGSEWIAQIWGRRQGRQFISYKACIGALIAVQRSWLRSLVYGVFLS